MKERFFDYQLTMTVPNDGLLHKAVLPLTDGNFAGDWPFELRALSFIRPYDVNTATYPAFQSSIQIRTPDEGTFDSAPVPIETLDPSQSFDSTSGTLGRVVRWRACFPFKVWPARGVFEVDFYNSGAATETVTMVFHGVHHVPDNLLTGSLLPPRFVKEFFDYVTVTSFTALVEDLRNQTLLIDGDADFVLCGITSSYRFAQQGTGRMLDENGTETAWTSVLPGPIVYTITSTQDSPDADIHITVVGNDVAVSYPLLLTGDDLVAAWNADPAAAALMTASPGNAHASALVAGVWTVGPGSANISPIGMQLQFKDQAGRRHSNALIDIRDQCQVIETPSSPRWFWPPVFLPRNGSFLFDLVRDDSGGWDAVPAGDVYLRWIGFKVRPAC